MYGNGKKRNRKREEEERNAGASVHPLEKREKNQLGSKRSPDKKNHIYIYIHIYERRA